MSYWPSTKAKRVLAALLRIGWKRPYWPDGVFAFRDDVEIDPKLLSKIAKKTGWRPSDL